MSSDVGYADSEMESLKEKLSIAVKALEFYSKTDGNSFITVKTITGGIMSAIILDDCTYETVNFLEDMVGKIPRGGKTAREALEKIKER